MVEEWDKDALCHRFYSTHTASALSKGALEALGDSPVGGEALRTVRYANDLVLLPKEPGSCKLVRTKNRLHNTVQNWATVQLKCDCTR